MREAEQAIANYRQFQERGIPLPTDDTALQRQRLELIARQIELDTRRKQIEGQLRRLMGVCYEPSIAWAPIADLAVSMATVDREAAVTAGMPMRADVAILRILRDRLGSDTLPAVRNGMQQTSGLLGAASPAERKLLKIIARPQDDVRRTDAEGTAGYPLGRQDDGGRGGDTSSGAEVQSRLRQAAVAKHQWDRWQENVRGLQEKQTVEKATTFDISAAQLHALQAESDAVSALVAWRIAEAKLQQAQGFLASPMRL